MSQTSVSADDEQRAREIWEKWVPFGLQNAPAEYCRNVKEHVVAEFADALAQSRADAEREAEKWKRHAYNMEETVDNIREAMGFESTHWQILPSEVEAMRKERDLLRSQLSEAREEIERLKK